MIPPDDIKAGNWISLKYPGSLIAARKVLKVSEDGVVIENGKTNTLIKVGNGSGISRTYRERKKSILAV